MRGEHDRCFFSFSLAACLSGEDSFIFSASGSTAPNITRIGAGPKYEGRPGGPQGGGKCVVFSPYGLPEAIIFVGGCQAVKRA